MKFMMRAVFLLPLILLHQYTEAAESSCKYPRTSSMLRNGLQDATDERYPRDDTTDTVANHGNFAEVTMTESFNILEIDNYNKLKIHDNGFVEFGETADILGAVFDYNVVTGIAATARHDRSYAAVKWFDVPAAAAATTESFKYSYRHLKRTDLTTGSGLAAKSISAVRCDFESVEAKIDGCFSDYTRGRTSIKEMVVITWEIIDDDNEKTFFQMILAVDSVATKNTYIVMIYDGEKNIDYGFFAGYINSEKTDGSSYRRFNVIMNSANAATTTGHGPESATSSAEMTKIFEGSNCRCGKPGTYVFNTRENIGDSPAPTNTVDKHVCDAGQTLGVHTVIDDTTNISPNCRLPVVPDDTCLESFYCVQTAADTYSLKIFLRDPIGTTIVHFLDYADAVLKKYTRKPGQCEVSIASNSVSLEYKTSTGALNSCITTDGTKNIIQWAIDVSPNDDLHTQGTNIIYGTCDIRNLPSTKMAAIPVSDILSTTVPVRANRGFNFEVIDRRDYTANTQVLSGIGNEVKLGRELYVAICYQRGTPYNENADPYGIYGTDLEISNDGTFTDNAGQSKYTKTLIGSNGCAPSGISLPLKLEDTFIKSTNSKAGYDWCQITGMLGAVRWYTLNTLFFRVKISTCANFDIRSSSKCTVSCGSIIINVAPGGRKRRDISNSTEEEVTLTTVVNFVTDNGGTAAINCVERTTAMSTVIALLAFLVLAVTATILLFVKMQMQKKRK